MACGRLGTDLDAVIAIEVTLPDSGIVERGDTMIPRARALNGRGDSVAAPIAWASLDPAIVAVVDSASGATLGLSAGSGRIQARVGSLRSNPIAVTVQPPADSARAEGVTRDTVVVSGPPPDSLSDSLRVRLAATPSTPQNLVRRLVTFDMSTYPAGSSGATLVPNDTVRTTTQGIAVVQVRLAGGPRPDSVIVTGRAQRADGTPVPGSPITFVVEFRP